MAADFRSSCNHQQVGGFDGRCLDIDDDFVRPRRSHVGNIDELYDFGGVAVSAELNTLHCGLSFASLNVQQTRLFRVATVVVAGTSYLMARSATAVDVRDLAGHEI